MRGKSSRVAVAAGLAAVTAVAVACAGQAAKEAAAPGQDQGAAPAADMNILVVGMDSGPGRTGDRTDTVALVHVPKSGDSAAIVSLPRDLYFDTGKKLGKARMSAIYPLALAAERRAAPRLSDLQVAQKAQEDLVAAVQTFTGQRVDHYAQVDMTGFVELSTVVGGVEVCLKEPQHDPTSGADFPAGRQKLVGEPALAFVRQRHAVPNGDLNRVQRQQVFLTGLVDAVVKGGVLANPAKRDRLLAAVRKYVVLDQKWDLVSFANQVRGLSSANIRAAVVPLRTEELSDGSSVLVAVPAGTKGFVQYFFTAKDTDSGNHTLASQPHRVDGAGPVCVS